MERTSWHLTALVTGVGAALTGTCVAPVAAAGALSHRP